MKKLIITAISIFAIGNSYCQELEVEDIKKNEIAIVLLDLIDGSYNFKYERLLGDHFSANLGLAYKGENGLFSLSGLDGEKIKTNDITYSGLKITPELRYYLNNSCHESLRGFYFGAYLKYSRYQSDLIGTYINTAQESFSIEFDATVKVTSVGFMVGYKLPISKRFSLDFLIAGPGSGNYEFTFKNKKDLPDEFYEDFNNALEKYPIFNFLNGDFRFSSIDRKTKFSAVSFRYGISLGYSF